MHLRPLDPEHDLPLILEWADDEALMARVSLAPPNPRLPVIVFLIETANGPIGGVELYNVTPDGSRAEIGVYVADERARGIGLGLRAARQVLQHAFTTSNLRTVLARVSADNADVLALMPRLGFVRVGQRGEAVGFRLGKDTFQRKWGDCHGEPRGSRFAVCGASGDRI